MAVPFIDRTYGGGLYHSNLSAPRYFSSSSNNRAITTIGLTALRTEFSHLKPLMGARIAFSSRTISQAASLTLNEALTDLGALFLSTSCSCNNLSTHQDHATASVSSSTFSVAASTSASACETRPKCSLCTERSLDRGPNIIIDDTGDLISIIHERLKADEEIFMGSAKSQSSVINDRFAKSDPFLKGLVGACVGTTTGVKRLLQMQANGALSFPAININDSLTDSKYSNLYGSRRALLDGLMRATNMTISGKRAVVCGYDNDDSEGCAMALKLAGADVAVYAVDPKHAIQAALRGFSVIHTLDDVVTEADILVTNFNKQGNNMDNVFNHIKKMKNNAIIYIIDPISLGNNYNDTYADLLEQHFSGMKRNIVNPQTDKWISYETNSSIMVLRNTGCPNLRMSWLCTSYVLGVLDLWSKRGTGKYEDKVYAFHGYLEDKVSDLHLCQIRGPEEEASMASVVKMAKKETKGGQAVPVSVTIQEQGNIFTATAETMSMRKILSMVIQAGSIFGFLAFVLNKASKVELSFSAIWE